MLLDDLLGALAQAGVACRETYFVSAPKSGPFAICDVGCQATGGDCLPAKRAYTAQLSLMEHPGDPLDARAAVESALDGLGLEWERGMREWSEDERLCVTDYTFSWAEKAPRQ